MNTIYNVALKIDLSLNEQTKCRDEESQSQNGKPHNVEIFHPKLDVDYLFKSRYHQLKGFIRKRVHCDEDAEDLAQTTYMEALTKAHNYQGLSRPDVWLFGIALNMVRNHRKKEANRHRVWEQMILPEYEEAVWVDGPSQLIEKADFATRLYEAIQRLPEEMMEVFHAIIIDNLSYQEAAGKFGIPTGTIRSRLSRARSHLKALMS